MFHRWKGGQHNKTYVRTSQFDRINNKNRIPEFCLPKFFAKKARKFEFKVLESITKLVSESSAADRKYCNPHRRPEKPLKRFVKILKVALLLSYSLSAQIICLSEAMNKMFVALKANLFGFERL